MSKEEYPVADIKDLPEWCVAARENNFEKNAFY